MVKELERHGCRDCITNACLQREVRIEKLVVCMFVEMWSAVTGTVPKRASEDPGTVESLRDHSAIPDLPADSGSFGKAQNGLV